MKGLENHAEEIQFQKHESTWTLYTKILYTQRDLCTRSEILKDLNQSHRGFIETLFSKIKNSSLWQKESRKRSKNLEFEMIDEIVVFPTVNEHMALLKADKFLRALHMTHRDSLIFVIKPAHG